MKEMKGVARVAFGITLAVGLFLGMVCWAFVNSQNWPITGALVVLGIFAYALFSGVKGDRPVIWAMCSVLCFLMIVVVVIFGYPKESQSLSYVEPMVTIKTDYVYRSGIWKAEERQEEKQILLLLVEITGKDIDPVMETLLPISKKELSGSSREKAGKPTQGPTSQYDGGPNLFFIKREMAGNCSLPFDELL